MSKFEIIKHVHYGKCNDVFISRDSKGNKYAVKRFYKSELEKTKCYTNRQGKLVRKDWLEDFKRSLEIQLMVDDDSCIKCHAVFGIDLSKEVPIIEEEIELVFDFAECGSLMDLESFDVPIAEFPKGVVKCIAKDMLQALQYLATINVAHRDVKPSNIFMNKQGRSKLGDFGESDIMTKDGKVRGSKGSYYYLAPEVFELNNDEKDGSAIDMWALGVTLWILYFRRFPFSPNKSMYESMEEIQNFNFKKEIEALKRSCEERGEEWDEGFVDLLGRILENDPNVRMKPKEALNHPSLGDVDYEVARLFCLKNKKSLL
ncbi:serine/threonine protein kinase [Theileria orientalis strain Shintoku]|uniref:Serine/threonine protein kinase n=1 Tax=Theileria orientalis strain Shintoku TaxID=869250 RepID=J4CD16_THEOR|nr:serine/threonine protein kinase [Theileria orientalis strain Shintoku]BAM40357.1 serine/threonine protein kinase [Theileria orientalis strain Shintoku]|eukprot:XP_009690658.1 serine/threonine protein kinase [Theileria orientalis strain Shintoku]